MFHTVEGARYRTGLRAPKAAQTLASTGGTKAAATLTFASQPNNDEAIRVGHPSRSRLITFKTTLVTTGLTLGCQVLSGANLAATIANLEKLVNGTGIHGVDYFNDQQHRNATIRAFKFTDPGNADVSITSTTGTTAVFTAGSAGTLGNSYKAVITTGVSAQILSFGTGSLMTSGASGTGTEPGDRHLPLRQGVLPLWRRGAVGDQPDDDHHEVQQREREPDDVHGRADARRGDAPPLVPHAERGRAPLPRRGRLLNATSEPYVDAVSDETLVGAFTLLYDETLFRPYAAGYPRSSATSRTSRTACSGRARRSRPTTPRAPRTSRSAPTR